MFIAINTKLHEYKITFYKGTSLSTRFDNLYTYFYYKGTN